MPQLQIQNSGIGSTSMNLALIAFHSCGENDHWALELNSNILPGQFKDVGKEHDSTRWVNSLWIWILWAVVKFHCLPTVLLFLNCLTMFSNVALSYNTWHIVWAPMLRRIHSPSKEGTLNSGNIQHFLVRSGFDCCHRT
jgi:hypothetical protein